MLFSRTSVANYLNLFFEPVWQSVRPVPILRIDFGNGKVLTRTLHGNILTSVCTSDGRLVDALPGIYEEKAYLQALAPLHQLARDIAGLTPQGRDARLLAYHQQEARRLAAPNPQAARRALKSSYLSKALIEQPVKRLVQPVQAANTAVAQATPQTSPPSAAQGDKGESWRALVEDTRLNEGARRRQIHETLARPRRPHLEHVLRPIYREVLHADLDDPYLGLGKSLFATYPFAREDKEL